MSLRLDNDIIAAISTPLGEGGLGVVRVTGPGSTRLVDQVFLFSGKVAQGRLVTVATHTVHYGFIVDQRGERVDEVLVTVMLAPRTYTREDTVEISCHGGVISVQRVLEALLVAGARLAEPGEFTKRAFLNGRIDLVQAEAVIDLIRAKTESSHNLAMHNLRGDLSKRFWEIRESLLQVLTYLEASIDFPEDEIPPLAGDLDSLLSTALFNISGLIDTVRIGRIYREGLATVIIGRPNVGKSSLLNALLDTERAIVTQIPGTTRDLLEEYLNLQGLPLKIIDTAGIRSSTDEIEKIGVYRSKEALSRADLVLFLIDYSHGAMDEDIAIAASLSPRNTILVANKVDLPQAGPGLAGLQDQFGEAVRISAKQRIGLQELKDKIIQTVGLGNAGGAEGILVSNLRHWEALKNCQGSLETALQAVRNGMEPDLVSIDLHAAVLALGEITGDTASADLLERIFSSFCIGK